MTVRYHTDEAALPYYSLPEDALEAGASLGNSQLWAPLQARGAVEGVFCIPAGQLLLGSFFVRYGLATGGGYTPLEQDGPAQMELHPAYQRRTAMYGGAFAVEETIFCPLGPADEPPLVYFVVHLRNVAPTALTVRVLGLGRLCGGPSGQARARFDLKHNAIIAKNVSNQSLTRAIGCTAAPLAWAVTRDWSPAYDPWTLALPEGVCEEGDTLGALQLDIALEPGKTSSFAFILGVGANGEAQVRTALRTGLDHKAALLRTRAYLADALSEGRVLTPDPVINDGALWSKVNMRRVMARTEQGAVFSNDPGKSPAVVGRDAAWFIYGCDHAWPSFSRELLDGFIARQAPNGLIPEFFNSVDGHAEDDGLNINDDTPLFVLAAAHYVRTTHDRAWLEGAYPAVAKAARCLLAERDERGLVYCSAEDPRGNVWASATWRNIITGYSLNGAVTEINAESVAALRAAAELATLVPVYKEEADFFYSQADALQAAMDTHLLDPESGLYYLNVDTSGVAHADVTGDLVFPVLFGACPDAVAQRITRRLGMADLWTDAGLRTVSLRDPRYDPSAGVGLLGGVWPGLTWWYAFSCRRHHPEMMARALRSSFAHYARDPRLTNTVPGQFSEWFDGQSLANRGMRLSPWEPPRFLWAAIEGVCGFEPSMRAPAVDPCFPPGWTWVALRRLPCAGRYLSYVAAMVADCLQVWATEDVWAPGTVNVYAEDVSEQVTVRDRHVVHVALRRPGVLWVFLGHAGQRTTVAVADLSRVLTPEWTYSLYRYDVAAGAWSAEEPCLGIELGQVTAIVEPGSFAVLEVRNA